MNDLQGYIVELRWTEYAAINPRYRGIDRTPYYSHQHFVSGFDDPIIFKKYSDDDGIHKDYDSAMETLGEYSRIHKKEQLEIVFVQAGDRNVNTHKERERMRLFGWDVAGTHSPFYSIVGDFPPDKPFEAFFGTLNEFGLFPSPETAREYLKVYREHELPDFEAPFSIWSVFGEA